MYKQLCSLNSNSYRFQQTYFSEQCKMHTLSPHSPHQLTYINIIHSFVFCEMKTPNYLCFLIFHVGKQNTKPYFWTYPLVGTITKLKPKEIKINFFILESTRTGSTDDVIFYPVTVSGFHLLPQSIINLEWKIEMSATTFIIHLFIAESLSSPIVCWSGFKG